MNLIAVLNLGTGNLRSVQKALQHVADSKFQVNITDNPKEVSVANYVVFPGQGAIGTCMQAMVDKGLHEVVENAMRNKPFLGICLGLQALYDYSEEGEGTDCLGVLRGTVSRFRKPNGTYSKQNRLKIPHMGWNTVHQTQSHPLWKNIPQETRFYFVHSYRACSDKPDEVFGVTDYGESFTAAGGVGNVFAVQFHPEKSQQYGLQLLRNFIRWDGRC